MNIAEFLKPDIKKLGATILIYILIGAVGLLAGWNFFMLLLTPTYTMYADVAYTYFNWYILLWVPLYLLGCTAAHIYENRANSSS